VPLPVDDPVAVLTGSLTAPLAILSEDQPPGERRWPHLGDA
jgi:hypothetical protein